MTEVFDPLKLENQLCFPLYVCSKEIVRQYKPFLDELDLTYTQYIAMMALWEHKSLNVKGLGEYLFLDSGTLTPVLKTLEKKGWIRRERSKDDERVVMVTITEAGLTLRKKALDIPQKISQCVDLSPEDAIELHRILNILAGSLSHKENS